MAAPAKAIPHPPALPAGEPRPPMIPFLAWPRRNRHLSVPLAMPALFAAGGAVLAAEPAWRGEAVAASAVAAGAMWLAAPHKWDRPAEVWYARASAAAAAGWLCSVAWTGITPRMLAILLGGCAAWGAAWWHHKRPRAQKARKGITGEWDAWWLHHAPAWNLSGSGVVEVTTRGGVETLTVQLWAGRQTVRQVEDARPLIESALAGYVRHGMVRVAKVPGNPSRALVHLKRENPLAGVVEWDPSMVPMSITEPAMLGVSEDGGAVLEALIANWFIIGKSRSGKSNELSLLLSVITGVYDARAWLIDRKGGRAARPWMPALDWCATTLDEARLMLRAAVAEVEARAMHAYDGHEQLRPTSEVPALFVIIDETHEVTSMMRGDAECAALLAALASMGMGVAVYVIVLTQYGALEESVRTEQTRSNLPNRICFAVNAARHGAFALTDFEKLDASRLREKGSFYYQLGPDAASAPARAPHMPHELVASIAARNGAMPRVPLLLYAADWQETYDTRWSRLPAVFRPLAPRYAASAAAGESAAPEVPVTSQPEDDGPRPNVVTLAHRQARVEAEVADLPDTDLEGLRLPSDADLRGEMARRKVLFARDLMEAGPDGISPARLVRHTGLSRSWVHQQLAALTERGSAERVDRGAYRGRDGVNVWDEMEAIRMGADALLSQPA